MVGKDCVNTLKRLKCNSKLQNRKRKEMKKYIIITILIAVFIISGTGCSISKNSSGKIIPFSGGVKDMIEKGIIVIINPVSEEKNSSSAPLLGGTVSHCKIVEVDNNSITVSAHVNKGTWYSGVKLPLTGTCKIYIMHKTNYQQQVDVELKKHPNISSSQIMDELIKKLPYKATSILQVNNGKSSCLLFGEDGTIEDLKKEIGSEADIKLEISDNSLKLDDITVYSSKP